MVSDLCISPTATLMDQQSLLNSRDSRPNIFLDTMLSETQCIVSWILTAVYVSLLCLERAGVYSLALCLFSSFVTDVMHV